MRDVTRQKTQELELRRMTEHLQREHKELTEHKPLEEMPPQELDDIFSSMYDSLPPHVVEQMQELRDEVSS